MPCAKSGPVNFFCSPAIFDPFLRPGSLWTSAADKGEKLGSGGDGSSKTSQHRRGGHHRVLLLNPSHHHAQVLSLDGDTHAVCFDRLHDEVRNLIGEALLNLQASRIHVLHARQLADAKDAPLGNVANVAATKERKEVMLAKAVELDVPGDHHVVGLLGEDGLVDRLLGIGAVTRGQKPERLSYPQRRLNEPLAIRILADFRKQFPHQPRDFFMVDLALHVKAPFAAAGLVPKAAPWEKVLRISLPPQSPCRTREAPGSAQARREEQRRIA